MMRPNPEKHYTTLNSGCVRSGSLSLGIPPLDYIPVVLDVVGGHRGIGDPVVDDRVHAHRHRVPRQDLEKERGCQ